MKMLAICRVEKDAKGVHCITPDGDFEVTNPTVADVGACQLVRFDPERRSCEVITLDRIIVQERLQWLVEWIGPSGTIRTIHDAVEQTWEHVKEIVGDGIDEDDHPALDWFSLEALRKTPADGLTFWRNGEEQSVRVEKVQRESVPVTFGSE